MNAESAKILVGRIILEFFPKFKLMKSVLSSHIPHQYSEEMTKKSNIYPFLIQRRVNMRSGFRF